MSEKSYSKDYATNASGQRRPPFGTTIPSKVSTWRSSAPKPVVLPSMRRSSLTGDEQSIRQQELQLARQSELERRMEEQLKGLAEGAASWADEEGDMDYSSDPFSDTATPTIQDDVAVNLKDDIKEKVDIVKDVNKFIESTTVTTSTISTTDHGNENKYRVSSWRSREELHDEFNLPTITSSSVTSMSSAFKMPEYGAYAMSRQRSPMVQGQEMIVRNIVVKLTSEMEAEIVPVKLPRRP